MFYSPAAPKFLQGQPSIDRSAYKIAVIFDCDGVLVDTEFLKYKAWAQALEKQNISFKLEDYMSLLGYSSKKIMEGIIKNKQLTVDGDSIIKDKNVIYDRLQGEGVMPMEESINYLKELMAKKDQYQIKIGIASSPPKMQILENLRQIGFNEASFDCVVSGSDDLKHIIDSEGTNKPKPYIYQLIAQKLGVETENCIVFEDSGPGVTAAALAGMSVIAVPNQYTNNHDFSLAKAKADFKDMTFEKMNELAFLWKYKPGI